MIKKGFLYTLVAALTFACAFARIDDLRLNHLELTNSRDAPEAHEDLLKEVLIRASFSSAVDLTAVDDAVTLGANVYFCDRPQEKDRAMMLGLGGVFWRGAEIPDLVIKKTRIRSVENHTNSGITYSILIRVAIDLGPSETRHSSFDLWKNPENICFNIVGGAYRALGYHSNTVMISAKEIADLMAQLPENEAQHRCPWHNGGAYLPIPGHDCPPLKI